MLFDLLINSGFFLYFCFKPIKTGCVLKNKFGTGKPGEMLWEFMVSKSWENLAIASTISNFSLRYM